MNSNDPTSTGTTGPSETTPRRDFLSKASAWIMGGGLVAGYGSLIAMALRFLFPSRGGNTGWRFVATLRDFQLGQSINFTAPSGITVVIARKGEAAKASSFIALSNVCPHLGCHVHWEEQNNRFFCPCHNGVFDPLGKAIGGPPGKAHQRLKEFPTMVVNGLLFVKVPLETVGKQVAVAARSTTRNQAVRRA